MIKLFSFLKIFSLVQFTLLTPDDVLYINDNDSFEQCVNQQQQQICILINDIKIQLTKNLTINNKQILGNNHSLTIIKSKYVYFNINNSQILNGIIRFSGKALSFIDYQNNTQWRNCIITSLIGDVSNIQNIVLISEKSQFINCQFDFLELEVLFAIDIRNNYFENNTFIMYNTYYQLISQYIQDTIFNNTAFFVQKIKNDLNVISGSNNTLINTILRIAENDQNNIILDNTKNVSTVQNFYYLIYQNQDYKLVLNKTQLDITNKYLLFETEQYYVPNFQHLEDTYNGQQIITEYLKVELYQEDQPSPVVQIGKLSIRMQNQCDYDNMVYYDTTCIEDSCGVNGENQCLQCQIEEQKFICHCQTNFNITMYCTTCENKYVGGQCKILRNVYGGVYIGLTLACIIIIIICYFIVQQKSIIQKGRAMREIDYENSNDSFI